MSTPRLALAWLSALLLTAGCTKQSPLPARLDLTSELNAPGNPDASLRALTKDVQFTRFDGNYPSPWPQEFVLPKGVLLNHGGKITLIGTMAGYVVATGVIRGNRRQASRALLHGLEAVEKKASKLTPAQPAQFLPRQWTQAVTFRTYTQEGQLSLALVDDLPYHPGLCVFSIAVQFNTMPSERRP